MSVTFTVRGQQFTSSDNNTPAETGLILSPGEPIGVSISGATPGYAISVRYQHDPLIVGGRPGYPDGIHNAAVSPPGTWDLPSPWLQGSWSGTMTAPTADGTSSPEGYWRVWFLPDPGGAIGFYVNRHTPISTAPAVTYSPKVTVTNFTGSGPIQTGDQYRVTITGAQPGAPVKLNGAPLGATDSAGTWSTYLYASSAGTSAQTWTIGSQTVSAAVSIAAAPAPTPPPATTPATAAPAAAGGLSVALRNLTTGENTQIRAGLDTWRVVIAGAHPGAPITVTASKDGGPQSTSQYGTADASGAFSLEAQSSASDIGTWSEEWKAGGVTAGTVSVRIVAPSSTPAAATDPSAAANQPAATNQPTITAGGVFDDLISNLPGGAQDAIHTATAAAEGLPSWALYGGAAALAWLLFAGRKKR